MPDSPEPFEPSLPATMRSRTDGLREGWTTGTCASAAAKAATLALVTGECPDSVEVGLPLGGRVSFPVARCGVDRDAGEAEAVVVKDAGDDPDVTHLAELTAAVRRTEGGDLVLRGGSGVGVVTKPGLGLEVGAPAINPVPRRMIAAMVREASTEGGFEVTISVPGGEEMAKRTTNARLGILGGISILGTRGIVKPFSTAAYRASIRQAIDVAAAQGIRRMVLATGGRTERAAMEAMPDLDQASFVEVGDFTGFALKHCRRAGMRHVTFVAMMGKLTKLAAGVMMTHYTRSRVDTELLATLARDGGAAPDLITSLHDANTARHAYELCVADGHTGLFGVLVRRVYDVLEAWLADPDVEITVVMADFDGRYVASSDGSWTG